jgi:sugar lactone lactonase YvrE
MILKPSDVEVLADGLDHPECVCLNPEGEICFGEESGNIRRIRTNGEIDTIANTGGFILGVASDGAGGIHVCDAGRRELLLAHPDGKVTVRCGNCDGKPLVNPNYGVFDSEGNFYFSDSGDYWNSNGDGNVVKIDVEGDTTAFSRGTFQFPNGLAIDPDERFLYVVESTLPGISRIPLRGGGGRSEVVIRFPKGMVPDGIAFTADGRLIVACYKPDAILLAETSGKWSVLYEDPTGEILNRPTNVCFKDDHLIVANLGGWSIVGLPTDFSGLPLNYPKR